jgi:hypothetical protein
MLSYFLGNTGLRRLIVADGSVDPGYVAPAKAAISAGAAPSHA